MIIVVWSNPGIKDFVTQVCLAGGAFTVVQAPGSEEDEDDDDDSDDDSGPRHGGSKGGGGR